MNVSITQAHKLTGVARSTIYKDIDEGRLSVNTNARGKKTIMVSELQRVYGDLDIGKLEDEVETSSNVADDQNRILKRNPDQSDQVAVLQERIESLRSRIEGQDEIIDDLKSERKQNRQLYEEQIEVLKEALTKAQDGYNNLTKLLEDKTSEAKGNEWQKSIKALETRIANQEKSAKEREEREQRILRQNKALKQALDKEKSKTIWQRLFG